MDGDAIYLSGRNLEKINSLNKDNSGSEIILACYRLNGYNLRHNSRSSRYAHLSCSLHTHLEQLFQITDGTFISEDGAFYVILPQQFSIFWVVLPKDFQNIFGVSPSPLNRRLSISAVMGFPASSSSR